MIPLWLKITYTALAVAVLALYWRRYGPRNFLWFSDIALIVLVPALWLESAVLAGAVAVGTLALELFWNLDFLYRLMFARRDRGLTGYMFDRGRPLWLRGLSLFHVLLPAVILWLLSELGYDQRGFPLMLALGGAVLLASWRFTHPEENINWVHGLGGGPRLARAPLRSVLALMLGYAVLVWGPSHWLLTQAFPAPA